MIARTVRALAILQGLFLASGSFLDILGLVPHSEAMPPLTARAAHSGPLAAAGVLLLIPHRAAGARRFRIPIACGLTLVVAWFIYVSADGVAGYLLGKKSWHVVPVATMFSAMAIGNLWAFMRITSGGESRRPTRPAPSP